MGRSERFPRQLMLDAAAHLVGVGGPAAATIGAVASRVGCPTGSIYHRFPSREDLLGQMWAEIATSFQNPFVELLSQAGEPVAVATRAALHTPAWVRAHPAEARAFLLHRREEVLPDGWPGSTRPRAETMRVELREALMSFADRVGRGTDGQVMERCLFALVDLPHAAVRRHVAAGRPPPPQVDSLISACVDAAFSAPAGDVTQPQLAGRPGRAAPAGG